MKISLVCGLYMISVSVKLTENEQMHILCSSVDKSWRENVDLQVISGTFWDRGALFEQSIMMLKRFIWILLLMRSATCKKNFRSFKTMGRTDTFWEIKMYGWSKEYEDDLTCPRLHKKVCVELILFQKHKKKQSCWERFDALYSVLWKSCFFYALFTVVWTRDLYYFSHPTKRFNAKQSFKKNCDWSNKHSVLSYSFKIKLPCRRL